MSTRARGIQGIDPVRDRVRERTRREFVLGSAATTAALAALPTRTLAQLTRKPKTIYTSFPAAETGFDPAQVSDLYSNGVIRNIFEAPLQYDYLARPAQLMLCTAAEMPRSSDGDRTFTVRLRPGIYFQDDPAFKGQRREMVAADCVYQFKRVFDPRFKSPHYAVLSNAKPLGMEALRTEAQKTGRFDYDRPVDGIRVLDRYVFEVRLAEPDPRFIYNFTIANYFGAVAREVVESVNETELQGRPVGTGPFRLADWRRASRIVLERNPTYREELYSTTPAADDVRGIEAAQQLAGKRVPLIDRVEISIINETQPQWLAFLNSDLDIGTPGELLDTAAPNGQIAPALAKRGIWLDRAVLPDIIISYFNMQDPLVGGYTPEKVALRRAIGLSYDLKREIRDLRRGQMVPAQSAVPPGVWGFDPTFVSDMGVFDPIRANTLLDTYGYLDRDGDGWREQPDGKPLLLQFTTQADAFSRASNELWQKSLTRIGLRVRFDIGQWPENAKAARVGKLMMWALGWSAGQPDASTFYDLGFSPNIGAANYARLQLPAYDELYRRQNELPNGPERLAVMREMNRLMVAYMPYKFHGHRIGNGFIHPWVIGYRRHPFYRDWFKWIDIDAARRARDIG
jgi:ABC-type transport system substrate-binding protein